MVTSFCLIAHVLIAVPQWDHVVLVADRRKEGLALNTSLGGAAWTARSPVCAGVSTRAVAGVDRGGRR